MLKITILSITCYITEIVNSLRIENLKILIINQNVIIYE